MQFRFSTSDIPCPYQQYQSGSPVEPRRYSLGTIPAINILKGTSASGQNSAKRLQPTKANHCEKFSVAPYTSAHAWQKWSSTHPNVFTGEIWTDPRYSDKLKLRIPEYILDVDHLFFGMAYISIEDQRDSEGIHDFRIWSQHWRSSDFEPAGSDPLEFRQWLGCLLLSWKRASAKDSSNITFDLKGEFAIARRRAVDDLLWWAISMRCRGHAYQPDVLVLDVPSYRLIPSGLATVKLPEASISQVDPTFRKLLFSTTESRNADEDIRTSVITFVFEVVRSGCTAGRDEGDAELRISKRRFVMALHTAQIQRRALRMTDGFVFGAILNETTLSIFVSYWRDDTLVVDRVFRRFCIENFGDSVECFFALCKIADFQRHWLEDEFARRNKEKV